MGVDCFILIDGIFHHMDRWHVFSDIFESGKKVDRIMATNAIIKETTNVMSGKKGVLVDEPDYNLHWLTRAFYILSSSNEEYVTFVTEDKKYEMIGGRQFGRLKDKHERYLMDKILECQGKMQKRIGLERAGLEVSLAAYQNALINYRSYKNGK